MKENKKAFFKVTKEKKQKKKTVKKVKEKTCDDCGLCRTCNTPKIKVTGRGKKEVLIIVDTPSQKDDRTGQLLSGMSGQLLQYILEKINIKLNQDCFITSAIKCRPNSNKKPNIKQINICRKYLFETIEKYNPKLIICMGEIAWKSLMSKRMTGRIKNVSFSDFIGEQIPDQALKKWVCPVYLPGYILQNTKDKVLKKLWKRNIKKAFDTVDKLFPVHDFDDSIRVINEEKQAIECIDKIRRLDRKIIAFDYETTGLKPHRKGHKIVCASVCTGEYSYSFPFFASDEFRQAWKKLMMSKDIGKIAHNIGFEHTWTNIICNHTVSHWEWDTMLTAHSLHNRKKVNLKYLVFCKLGIIGFDSEVDEYIANPKKGEDKKSANAFNRIEECDEQLLLYYNAMDSLLTFQLYELQKKQISKKLIPGQQLFLKAAENLSEVPGIKINLDKKEEQKKILTEKMDRLHRLIMSSDEVQQTEEKEEFNFNSSKQLGNLLYNILKITCPKKTDTGLNSVDVDTLEKINIPLTKRILKYRKCKKIRDTYLAQYEREEVDSFLHPYFGLGTVKTYRSSSYNPNLQNVPVRNKEAMEIVRSLIIPRKGNKLLAYDYASQEVRVAACYNQDPNLIKYIIDPTTDMHRDTAMDIFIKEKDEITKEERTLAKSCFVFPAFYGSYYVLIAPDLWEGMSIETKQHLKNKGIKNYNSFENHIKKIEDIFWNEKFPVYAKWKKDIWNKYEKRGFIDHFTGFRCYGPIQRNKVINYATQGSAFHCLLWTFNRLVEEKHQFKKSHIIVEVHDEILFDAHPDDEAKIDYLMWYYATQKIKEVYPWLIVPLSIEKESSEINGSWAEMKDCGCLNFEKI